MAIIYTYPVKSIPVNADKILISDSADNNKTKQITVESIRGLTAGVTQIVAGTNVTIDPVDGTGNVTINASGGGGGTPGGSDTQMQYNNAGAFGGATGLTWNNSTNILSIATRYEGDIDGAVIQQVLVKEPGGVSKGDVVYISGGTGDNPHVRKAQANSVSTMSALGIMKDSSAEDTIGECVTTGEITGLSLTGFATGDELFVSNITAGGVLASAPTGEANLVQKIGKVIKGGSGGALTVLGAFRTNATPNLNQGSLFIGNGSNQASTLAIGANNTVLTSNGATASWQTQSETPAAGSAGQVQYNNGSNGFTASSGLSYSTASSLNTLTIGAQGGVAGVVEIKGADTTVGRLRLYCPNLISPHYFELMGPDHSGAATYSVQVPNTSPGATEKILSVSTWTSGTSTAKLGWVDLPVNTNIAENSLILTASRTLNLDTYSLQFTGSEVFRLSNATTSPVSLGLRVDNNARVDGQAYVTLDAKGNQSGNYIVDWNDSNIHSITLNGNLNITSFTNGNPGGCYILIITQPAEQTYTITWPLTVDWHNNNTAPGTITSDRTDVYTFVCRTSTSFLGTYAEDFII
jgi:hypothetical protein